MTAKAIALPLLSGLHCLQFDRKIFGQLSQQSLVFPQSVDPKKLSDEATPINFLKSLGQQLSAN